MAKDDMSPKKGKCDICSHEYFKEVYVFGDHAEGSGYEAATCPKCNYNADSKTINFPRLVDGNGLEELLGFIAKHTELDIYYQKEIDYSIISKTKDETYREFSGSFETKEVIIPFDADDLTGGQSCPGIRFGRITREDNEDIEDLHAKIVKVKATKRIIALSIKKYFESNERKR